MRTLLLAMLMSLSTLAIAADTSNPVVIMETNHGTIKIELWEDRAPGTVANFLRYVDAGFYNNKIFHRVIPNFMIQGGGMNASLFEDSTYSPIKNEAQADLKNTRGTIAMARTGVVDSATAQFFINLVDNEFLNHTDTTPAGYGYAAFGEVLEGMDVVDAIAQVPTGSRRGHQNVPNEAVVITSATRQ
jgi:cyclophilin family peptidyl-prolyl cis-trans isomerase